MANTNGNNAGANFGQKVRGGWNAVEGAGDKLRGGVLDFVDSATGTGGHHAETDIGDAKMRQGAAQTKQPTSGTAAGTTTATAPAATAGTGTNTTTAAPTAGANRPTTAATTNGTGTGASSTVN
ncbi:uncharacterized protein C8Q71DRAFT_755474 [Rhodofomes roseus]|uniref:CsbD-like domain-containing protein n=1 Tax=Rhodofomes roseus TaxID=34475 RepID=A0A4Y9Z2Y9_9APHY|nr:uncharacterized protein C8Q71DRAFT_755474 [Rhodofomes roseus]KAH9837986.1 hypothetical protein C8Q71DRAFT_755474 [Rhodofomes roseus]TFY68400.1 hypothetical protein EVJ58_g1030 [Rhodofomes roseus]